MLHNGGVRVADAPLPTEVSPIALRRLGRIAVVGSTCALLVLGAGWTMQRVTLGASDADARSRVEADVRTSFDQMARTLRAAAAQVSSPQLVQRATAGDESAARELFAVTRDAILGQEESGVALTVFGTDGQPVAWAGRPSELRPDLLGAFESWFITRGALGLRLVYVTPVAAGESRLATIAAERSLSAADPSPAAGGAPPSDVDLFRVRTRLAPVSIELPANNATAARAPDAFEVMAPSGEPLVIASVSPEDLANTRERWGQMTISLALLTLAVTTLVLAGPVLDWRNHARSCSAYATAVLTTAAVIIVSRFMARAASPADWSGHPLFSAAAYASPLAAPLLASPLDFLLTASVAAALAGLLLFAVEAWRERSWRARRSLGAGRWGAFAAMQLAAGAVVAGTLIGHEAFVRNTIENTNLDLLHFSLHPWTAGRTGQHLALLALHAGLLALHATALILAVTALRAASVPWRVDRRDSWVRVLIIVSWSLPLVVARTAAGADPARQLPMLAALGAVIVLTQYATRLKARYRHGSQAFRLMLLALGLLVPACAFYPTLFQRAWESKLQLVATSYAPQAVNQRQTVQALLEQSLERIDRFPDLTTLVLTNAGEREPLTDRAFRVWQPTPLAEYPVTSSVELYDGAGRLVSRFAFNLPEDLSATWLSEERGCTWQIFEEVAPFFSEERRVLHAGRQICAPLPGSPALGSIVVHAMLDDRENLPFVSSRSPYVELLRPPDPRRGEGVSGRDVEYVVYGWSRRPLYASRDIAWQLDDAVFARVAASREPFWAELQRGGDRYEVFLQNDRGGIYALGVPIVSAFGHLVNLAEVTVLAMSVYLLLLAGNALFGALGRRVTTAPALLREIRASFYRKLFIAFVAAVFLPVVALAVVTRIYVADEMRANVEQEAIRTAAAARRVVEDLVAPQAAEQGAALDDNLMVWVSRLINQDVNIFRGPQLEATSERNLYASGRLPTRTHADVYHALELRKEAATVTREQIGPLEYLVAATPLTVRQFAGTLAVPLTSRQQEIDEQIDTLDRRVLLGVLLFILAGAGLGYSMAERISDPVNRLTRATRRIARGDLDARIAATSRDELRRLVEDFNSMAAELQRQRRELERTHRLEAWAEMARQVAHEIKNPLTPIQLNAEHLRRVHADRGEPLGPVLQECVATILSQVKLLRRIASEFSSFASSPTARPATVAVPELLHETIDPYRAGLAGRITVDLDVPAVLPEVYVDRTLIGRSITNIVENALHAMPGAGTLSIIARAVGPAVRIRISDTGVGMDAEALARAFEPYFSTKASGTGLGLPIAKRNVELSGGAVTVSSERDRGTTVEITLPVTSP